MASSTVARQKAERRADALDKLANRYRAKVDAVTRQFPGWVVDFGVDQAVRNWTLAVGEILRDAGAIAHLTAYADAMDDVLAYLKTRAATGKRLSLNVRKKYFSSEDAAYAYFKTRLEIPDAEVNKLRDAYGKTALDVLGPGGVDLGDKVRAALAESVAAGDHVEAGMKRIGEAMNAAGFGALKDYQLETIFRTQTKLAYSAGNYNFDQDPDIQEILWGYEYVTVGDDRVRPNHAALDGVRLPKGDPRWAQIRPPNGYNCRCDVVRIFNEEATKVVEPEPVTVDGVEVQPGPDPGFGFNAGAVYGDQIKAAGGAKARALDKALEAHAEDQGTLDFPTPKTVGVSVRTTPGGGGFPGALIDVGAAGGSTGARIVQDPETGQRYVMKKGTSPEHITEEFYADEAYRAMGVPVPPSKLYQTPEGPVKLSEFLEGEQLGTVLKTASPARRAELLKQVAEHFAADVLLANWDVAGVNLDNLLVAKDGKVYRIDNGGALRFRARGKPKGDQFNPYAEEVWSLRNRSLNPDAATAYSELDGETDAIYAQLAALKSKAEALHNSIPDAKLRDMVLARLDNLADYAETYRTLREDKFKPEYSDDFAKHTAGLRVAGFRDSLPAKLELKNPTTNAQLVDEQGREFDNIRGPGQGKPSASKTFSDYLEKRLGENGRDYVRDWGSSQARSSWSYDSSAVRVLLSDSREIDAAKAYYWKDGIQSARSKHDTTFGATEKGKARREALIAMHAANHEILRTVEIPNVDRKARKVGAIRTEQTLVCDNVGLKKKGDTAELTRGTVESFSLFRPVSVAGDKVTVQAVPLHRVFGNYFLDRPGRHTGEGFFMNDQENELAILTDGLKATYLGKLGSKTAPKYQALRIDLENPKKTKVWE